MNPMFVPINSWSMSSLPREPFSDAQPRDLPATQHEIEDHAREQHRREHVRHQSGDERDRESLDGAGAELEQEQRADDRGDVRIEDGAEGAGVAQLHRLANALLVAQLLADALEDQNV